MRMTRSKKSSSSPRRAAQTAKQRKRNRASKSSRSELAHRNRERIAGCGTRAHRLGTEAPQKRPSRTISLSTCDWSTSFSPQPFAAPVTKIAGHVFDAQSAWTEVPRGQRERDGWLQEPGRLVLERKGLTCYLVVTTPTGPSFGRRPGATTTGEPTSPGATNRRSAIPSPPGGAAACGHHARDRPVINGDRDQPSAHRALSVALCSMRPHG